MFYFSAAVLERSLSQFSDRHQVDNIDSNSSQTANTGNLRGATVSAALRSSDELGPLPPGWQVSTADNGRVFFIDHTKKRTTWVGSRSY